MADYDSSLPVRTENDGDIVALISDATVTSQKLKVNADGSIDVNASIPAGQKIIITDGADDLAVNADGSINSVVSATDLDIRDLVFATDSVDVSGSSVTVSGTDIDIRDLSAAQDNVAISDGTDTLGVNTDGSINVVATATDLDIRDLAFATDSVDVSGSSVTVSATDLDIRDLSASQDSVAAHLFDEAGVAFSDSNPLPVSFAQESPGDEIIDYNTTAALASAASTNHDYTVSVGKTFLGQEAWISGSGKLKVEILVNGSTVFVGFNSTANPNIRIPLQRIVKANAAEVIRFTITNREQGASGAQDVYSTLTGLEV